MATNTHRIPEAHEIHDGEVVVQFETSPDRNGHAFFYASWLDDAKPNGVASQAFTMSLEVFVQREQWKERNVVGYTDHDAAILRQVIERS